MKIEFEECLKDTPKFRQYLSKEENDIEHLEQRLERIIKMCTVAVDSGKDYIKNQSAFATSLWDLQKHFSNDKNAHNALGKVIHCFQEMNKYHTILLDQASRTVLKNLSVFVKDDINQVKDYKNHFTKVSESLDNALIKNAQASKNRPQEVQEAVNILAATKSCFQHTALDYVNYITLLQSRKIPAILSTLLDYYQACGTYFHQGSDLCNDFDEFFKSVSDEVNSMRSSYHQLEKSMQNRHTSVNDYTENNINQSVNRIEGYLFKRKSKGFKTWCRRWFYLCDNQLVYRKRSHEESYTVMEEDLRICTVRPFNDNDRRFCFEVISPTKSHILQADSADMLSAWINALQKSIGAALQFEPQTRRPSSSSPSSNIGSSKKKIHWEQFLKIPGNSTCCDCKGSEPRWASINLGITLCIACSGVHRSLGVHYSKVRSLTLDAWEPENVKVMMELGNDIINKIYEANYTEESGILQATENCENAIREAYIKAKYIEKKFVCQIDSVAIEMGLNAEGGNSENDQSDESKKWGVKKFRRRHRKDSSSKSDDDSINFPSMNLNLSREHLLLVGENLNNSTVQCDNRGILGSDQESTEGEDNIIEEGSLATFNSNLLLYKASAVHNLPVMSMAFALGADKLWKNSEDLNRTPLHQAVLSGSVMACEYLLLNGVPINTADDLGYTPLHLATQKGCIAQTYLLLKHKAQYDSEAKDGKKPIDIAVDKRNADIVTLLRLTRLNEEIGVNDEGNGEDETYKDVMKDFSNFASSQPRLLRNRNENASPSRNETEDKE
ncbi:arf-GAP with coiled-coil, ANK repeat and PH domain-containing protein 2 [Condylostylus longicornis]|uniref:arf-GAP with coiled-coil, ANK repeat and PH domain-containing protein 2 n=1 Tax=Condylostylus longicornis TaxID=2530218 RepID=UPI00244DFE34|nr:arf-GAP with coiled-coil, ANK repeat and PH domain-containing protein 2 [Condylostylus longicornis]